MFNEIKTFSNFAVGLASTFTVLFYLPHKYTAQVSSQYILYLQENMCSNKNMYMYNYVERRSRNIKQICRRTSFWFKFNDIDS